MIDCRNINDSSSWKFFVGSSFSYSLLKFRTLDIPFVAPFSEKVHKRCDTCTTLSASFFLLVAAGDAVVVIVVVVVDENGKNAIGPERKWQFNLFKCNYVAIISRKIPFGAFTSTVGGGDLCRPFDCLYADIRLTLCQSTAETWMEWGRGRENLRETNLRTKIECVMTVIAFEAVNWINAKTAEITSPISLGIVVEPTMPRFFLFHSFFADADADRRQSKKEHRANVNCVHRTMSIFGRLSFRLNVILFVLSFPMSLSFVDGWNIVVRTC